MIDKIKKDFIKYKYSWTFLITAIATVIVIKIVL